MAYFGTMAGFIAYHAARGNALAAAFDDAELVEPALLVANEWLESTYRSQLGGYKVGGRAQEREFTDTQSRPKMHRLNGIGPFTRRRLNN